MNPWIVGFYLTAAYGIGVVVGMGLVGSFVGAVSLYFLVRLMAWRLE